MKTPLSVHILYHSKYSEGQKIYQELYKLLCRNTRNPFADGLDIPVFFGTDDGNGRIQQVTEDISEKKLFFLLVDKHMRVDKEWQHYVRNEIIPLQDDNCILVCIDLYKYSYEFLTELKYNQFIGFHSEPLSQHWDDFELRVYDILIRFLEGEGKRQLKVFISHSKHDDKGKLHAEAFRDYLVQNTTKLSFFFDVNSIMEGYAFDKQIEDAVKDSIFVTIVTDSYSDREWCRKELIAAKKNRVPLIGVYLLDGDVERMFPYIGNMPGIAYHGDWKPVINLLLRTALNSFYQKKFLAAYIADRGDDTDMLTTPPEAFSFSIIPDDKTSVIYPEPPLCNEELNVLKDIRQGVTLFTPMESTTYDFHRRMIGVSISESDDQLLIGIGREMVDDTTVQLLRYILKSNGQIVYGGNLGPYTELFQELSYQYGKYDDAINGDQDKKYFTDYISWPYSERLSIDDLCEFDHCRVDIVKCGLPAGLNTDHFNPNKRTTENLYLRGRALTQMRMAMETATDDNDQPIAARIFIGGREKNFTGQMAGLLEEFRIAWEEQHPIFLIGGFGGVSKMLAEQIEHGDYNATDFRDKARMDAGYDAVMDYYHNQGIDIDYSFINGLTYASLRNGLTDDENRKLFHSVNLFEIIPIILKGINGIVNLPAAV